MPPVNSPARGFSVRCGRAQRAGTATAAAVVVIESGIHGIFLCNEGWRSKGEMRSFLLSFCLFPDFMERDE
ncbi:hypothetical protein L1987_48936 [Smallanthus sonchifolius]|uniref:Uncharacterized protein n=1 Tax=Smallanthus sonchifolius TaxID=185202 RepID=A0ACB9FSP3_9ASTR|nr:hypothetical protein L1987_48936 [Smallanthus sonchifolius]